MDKIAYLLLLPQGEKADTRDLDDLEADTGNITLGLATATETGDEDLVVLVDKVQATIILRTSPLVSTSVTNGAEPGNS